MEGLVKDNLFGEPFLERFAHLSLGLVHLVHNGGDDLEACLGYRFGGSSAGVGHGEERCAAPGTCDLGEEAVFDGVELGAARRIVHNKDFQSKPVDQVHEVLFDDMVPTGVGTAPVTEDYEHLCVRIEFAKVFSPDSFYVLAHELGGVVADDGDSGLQTGGLCLVDFPKLGGLCPQLHPAGCFW